MTTPVTASLNRLEWILLTALYGDPGLNYKHVADRFGVKTGTIKMRMRRIFAKTGTHSRVELAGALTAREWQRLMNPEIEVPKTKPRLHDGRRQWIYSFGSMSQQQRAAVFAQIRQDAEEIALRLGCENRLTAIMHSHPVSLPQL